ncbi:MAG: hypothetical protein KGQ70_00135, partial [Alphaproteobacteria bacterium]|nr:hypothetical protein [Alphaproteobacteria bacterium]
KRAGGLLYLLLFVIVAAAGAFWYMRYHKAAVPAVARSGVGYGAQDRMKLDKLIEQGDKK